MRYDSASVRNLARVRARRRSGLRGIIMEFWDVDKLALLQVETVLLRYCYGLLNDLSHHFIESRSNLARRLNESVTVTLQLTCPRACVLLSMQQASRIEAPQAERTPELST